MIKIGIIGTGFGSTQAVVFNALDGAEVEAICGKNYEKTKKIAKELGIPRVYRDYKKLLSDENLNLVSIPTPNYLHKEMFLEAIKTGKHIIHEKPAALTSKEIKELIGASKGYRKLIVVDHPMRFNPVIKKIKKMIEQGSLGKISNLQISQYTNYGTDLENPHKWMDTKKAGGGQVLLMGTHLMDIGRYILDMPKMISGNLFKHTIRNKKPDPEGVLKKVDVEEQIIGNILFENDVSYMFFNTMYSFGYKNFEIRMIGSKAILFYDDVSGLRISKSNNEPLKKIDIKDPLEHIQAGRSFVSKSFKFFAHDLVEYLKGNIKELNYCTLEEAKENLEYLEMIDKE